MSIAASIDLEHTKTLVCDVMDVYPDSCALLDPIFRNFGSFDVCHGRIKTIKCFEDNSKIHEVLNTSGQGYVLMVDGGGSVRHSIFGGNMALKALNNGWSGVIISGAVRDVAELRDIPLPIWALAPCPRHSIKRGHGEIDVPIRMAGQTICPGQYLYCDGDGKIITENPLH